MTTAAAWLAARVKLSKGERLAYALVAVWALAMIALPIVLWTLGDAALPGGVLVTTILQLTAVVVILAQAWGVRHTLITTGGVMLAAWTIEYIGSQTGFPFGAYSYTQRLQPQIGGVPLLIPLAWMLLLPSAWAVAACLVPTTDSPLRKLAYIGASALAFTAWDLFLDPQMVLWGFWTWHQPDGYFGIPWVNYLGWLLASALITALARPRDLPLRPLLVIYAIVWALQTIGAIFFWGLVAPGIVGSAAMGGLLLLALRRSRERRA